MSLHGGDKGAPGAGLSEWEVGDNWSTGRWRRPSVRWVVGEGRNAAMGVRKGG